MKEESKGMVHDMKLLHWGQVAGTAAGAVAGARNEMALRPYVFKKGPDWTPPTDANPIWTVHCTVDDLPDLQSKLDFAIQARTIDR